MAGGSAYERMDDDAAAGGAGGAAAGGVGLAEDELPLRVPRVVEGRGLHSFTSQLNLSRVCHKKTPYTP
jgi:hypothetical protein